MFHLLYASVRLVFGTLYPAYCSFKAVKTKNVKEYVHWMTYWIVFAMITLTEEVADIFLGFWFPLYHELKILLLIWLLSPATRGSSFLYRQVIHPTLTRREEDIDDFVKKFKEESYSLGVKYTRAVAQKMTTTVIETALAGGGGLVKTLRHSYSLSDLRGVQQGREESLLQDEGNESGDRVVQRSLYEDSEYQSLGEDGSVQRRKVRGRSKAGTGSTISLADDGEECGAWSEEKWSSRRRKTSSLYGTMPRARVEVGFGFSTRNGSQYGTLPRRAKKQRPALPNFAPLDRRPAQSKVDLMKEEPETNTLSSLKRQNSARGRLSKIKAS